MCRTHIYVVVLSFITYVYCQNQVNQPPEHQASAEQLHFRQDVHDKNHVMQHLDGVAKKREDMNDEELQFYYFKLHDYDQNNMLDGNELSKAMTHYHKEEGEKEHKPPTMPDKDIANMVDQILKEDDLNGDGYVSYAEFVISQKRIENNPPPPDRP